MTDPLKPLLGKTALITGSTSGIGLAIATTMAAKGANIMLNGLGDADAIEKTRATLAGDYGVQVGYHGADMTKPDEIKDMVETTHKEFGSLDILVNNAGIQYTNPIEKFDHKMWDKIIAINLTSAFYTMHYAVPLMRQGGFGRIINTASAHGLVASVEKAAYVASKHGIIGMSKVVALETAEDNITCNAVCPGWVLTDLVKKQIEANAKRDGVDYDTAKRQLVEAKQPSKEYVLPEQVGELMCFLCSDAAAQMTGSSYVIDGGWTAQ